MANNNRKFIGCDISDEEFRLLFRTGVMWGVRVDRLVNIAVRRFLSEVEPKDEREVPVDLKIFQALQSMKKDTDVERYLMDMAQVYQANPTEENSDILNECCQLAGYDLTQVLEWIEQDKLVPLLSSDMDTTADRAAMWLENMMNADIEYPATQILEEAEKAGFARSTIKTAKRKMSIQSVRREHCWVWVKPSMTIQ